MHIYNNISGIPLQFQDKLSYSRAYWVTEFVIAWNVDVNIEHHDYCILYSSKSASLLLTDSGIQGTHTHTQSASNHLPPAIIFIATILL